MLLSPDSIAISAPHVQPQVIPAPGQTLPQQTFQQTMADQKIMTNRALLAKAKVATGGLVELSDSLDHPQRAGC